MKHILTILTICLTLAACSSEITENRESRSTVYRGQTTWDMYENFGAPTKAERISENEVHFHYHHEAVTRDWTTMYYDWCDMTFVVVDDRVVDWSTSGNQCFLNVAPALPGYEGNEQDPNTLPADENGEMEAEYSKEEPMIDKGKESAPRRASNGEKVQNPYNPDDVIFIDDESGETLF